MKKDKPQAQNPLILRSHRIMEAYAKSNDERDFYLDRTEGFLIYVDLDKSKEELDILEQELIEEKDRYCQIPKLTFYETKKIMEGFVNEKVYDIDTKEKLLDVIQSKEARENFLEFIYDHHTEFEKWQQYYQERSRVRIIEWLRQNHFHFVFEEDLELPKNVLEKVKKNLFKPKVDKDVTTARRQLAAKAKTYYSTEALNPRPKRGRPPKQAIKMEVEQTISKDIFITVPTAVHPFLFTPEITSASAVNFSAKFEGEDGIISHKRHDVSEEATLESFNQKLAALRSLSTHWQESEKSTPKDNPFEDDEDDEDDEGEDFDEEEDFEEKTLSKKKLNHKAVPTRTKPLRISKKVGKKLSPPKKISVKAKPTKKPAKKTPPKKTPLKKNKKR